MYLHDPDRLTMSVEEAGKLLGIGRSTAVLRSSSAGKFQFLQDG